MMHMVFVYGTLKTGFRNQAWNEGRCLGRYRSLQRFPLWVLGPACLPWLSEQPGQGEQVIGELVEASEAQLARMDLLEELDRPEWYRRGRIALEPEAGGPPVEAWVYFGSASRAARETRHAGPLVEYTLALEQSLLARREVQADAAADRRRWTPDG